MKTEYRLDELFDLQMGKTPARNKPEYWNTEDHKWVSIADISKCGKYIIDTKEYISEKAVQETGISQIPANTVIMSFKLSIGKTAITPEPMYSNEAIMSFRDKHVTGLLPDYLYYMFSGRDWETGTNKAVMGKTLNKTTLSGTRIKVHDIDEQREIVAVLDKAKAVLDSWEIELEKLDDLIKARFVEMFGDPISGLSKWPVTTFGEQFDITAGGTPSTKNPEFWDHGNISWIGSNMCQDKILFENDGKYITEKGLKNSSAKVFKNGTVLVALVGATIGKTALLRFDTSTNQNVAAIDVNRNDSFTSEYIFYFMQMLYNKFQEIGSGKFKMANQTFIRELPLFYAPIRQQNRFSFFVQQVDKSKAVVQKSLDETQLLYDSLMQEYFG